MIFIILIHIHLDMPHHDPNGTVTRHKEACHMQCCLKANQVEICRIHAPSSTQQQAH